MRDSKYSQQSTKYTTFYSLKLIFYNINISHDIEYYYSVGMFNELKTQKFRLTLKDWVGLFSWIKLIELEESTNSKNPKIWDDSKIHS